MAVLEGILNQKCLLGLGTKASDHPEWQDEILWPCCVMCLIKVKCCYLLHLCFINSINKHMYNLNCWTMQYTWVQINGIKLVHRNRMIQLSITLICTLWNFGAGLSRTINFEKSISTTRAPSPQHKLQREQN